MMTKIEEVETDLTIQVTWHARLIYAAAKANRCTVKTRTYKRVIGGRPTAKADRRVILSGSRPSIIKTVVLVEQLMYDLNTQSTRFAAALGPDVNPTRRKTERRRWLEARAASEAERLDTEVTNGN